MAMTPRGRSLIGVTAILAVLAIAASVVLFGGKGSGSQAQGTPDGNAPTTVSPSPPPRICPLTGVEAKGGVVPNRPALAVKVENLPAARPQTGLSWADIIYEEPVEGGITRFIVVYQCQDASRIEPIRSGRLTDPLMLVQFGKPVFGYAGGVPAVLKAVKAAGLTDVNFDYAPEAYHRDSARVAPHNLYSSTRELYTAGKRTGGIPQPVFLYSLDVPTNATAAASVHVPFSPYSDVVWTWSAQKSAWLRSYGSQPATYSSGEQMSTTNVVIQMVTVKMTGIVDVNGVPSPEVVATGSGTAYVLRDGKVIRGTWSRAKLSDLTVFKDAQGRVIPLTPGTTWVELVPKSIHVTVG